MRTITIEMTPKEAEVIYATLNAFARLIERNAKDNIAAKVAVLDVPVMKAVMERMKAAMVKPS